MPINKVEQVRGVNDVLYGEYENNKFIEKQLSNHFESFGYCPIDVPILEHTELYLRKSGEDIITRLYDFVHRNRRLCLRPEITASVTRAYIDNFQGKELLPIRLYYGGPVFRYERPQKARYRQFTQIGVEMIGATGAMSDAEIIYSAVKGLEKLQLNNYRVVIGHIGVLGKFLESLDLESRLCSFLLANTDILRQKDEKGKKIVEKRLTEIYPAFSAKIKSETVQNLTSNESILSDFSPEKQWIHLFEGMEQEQAKMAILDLLENLNIQLKGNRKPDEIADRLLTKMRRTNQTEKVTKALEFISELAQISGEPSEVLAKGEKLLSIYEIDCTALDELRGIITILKLYDLDWSKIQLDLGLSRGLQYYTGMIFEIYHTALGEERQLCGGGRYDDLVLNLGGNEKTPATGFSYGVERIRLALESEEINLLPNHQPVKVLVIPASEGNYSEAIRIAQQLRDEGITVELEIKNKGVSNSKRYADKKKIPFVIVADSQAKDFPTVVLKNMFSGAEKSLTIQDIAKEIKQQSGL